MVVRRSSRAIAQNDPGFIKLGLQVRGYSVISQDDRDAALAPGDFAIYDTSRPYVLDFAESFEMFVVMFPAELLRFDFVTNSASRRASSEHGRTRPTTCCRRRVPPPDSVLHHDCDDLLLRVRENACVAEFTTDTRRLHPAPW